MHPMHPVTAPERQAEAEFVAEAIEIAIQNHAVGKFGPRIGNAAPIMIATIDALAYFRIMELPKMRGEK